MTTNCINCGAPLTGNKCEYCGTNYRYDYDYPESVMHEMEIAYLEKLNREMEHEIKMCICKNEIALNYLKNYANTEKLKRIKSGSRICL